jgi:hypothetical protein
MNPETNFEINFTVMKFRNTDALKLQEYTFSNLLKSVRIVHKDKTKEVK